MVSGSSNTSQILHADVLYFPMPDHKLYWIPYCELQNYHW